MRRRNRDITIFSLSMLDVFCGALGAFLIVMILLLPYYKKESIDFSRENEQLRQEMAAMSAELAQLQQQVQELQAQLAEAQAQAQNTEELQQQLVEAEQRSQEAEQRAQEAEQRAQESEQRAQRAEALLNQTFLLVYVRWETQNQDVDLHVIDPSGAEFYYEQQVIPGRPGELAEDSQHGPGNEVWEVTQAPPGEYQIYLKLYDQHGNPEYPTVRGKIFHRDGSFDLPSVTLTRVGSKEYMTTVVVSGDGSVSLR